MLLDPGNQVAENPGLLLQKEVLLFSLNAG